MKTIIQRFLGGLCVMLVCMVATASAQEPLWSKATSVTEGYQNNQAVVSCSLSYGRKPSALGWSATLPVGWSYVSDTSNAGVKPYVDDEGKISWVWIDAPSGGTQFSYTIKANSPKGNYTIAQETHLRDSQGTRVDHAVSPASVTLSPVGVVVDTLSITPTSWNNLSATGGTLPVSVTTSASSWTATSSNTTWLTVSGKTANAVNLIAAQNTSSSSRSATVTFNAGTATPQAITVNQPGVVAPQVPVLTAINPSSGPLVGGNEVALSGNNLTGATVKFGTSVATLVSNTATSIKVTVPPGVIAGNVAVTATTSQGTSAPLTYTYSGATAQTRVFSIDRNMTSNSGGTVTVPITLAAKGNEAGIDFSLKFDPKVFTNPVVNKGIGLKSNSTLTMNYAGAAQGNVGVLITTSDPMQSILVAGIQQIVTVTFTIASNVEPGAYDILFSDTPIEKYCSALDTSEIIDREWHNGAVTILSGYEGDIAPKSKPDNRVNSSDVTQLLKYVSKIESVEIGAAFQAADCAPLNTLGDGKINSSDVTMDLRYAAKLNELTALGGPAQANVVLVSEETPDESSRLLAMSSASQEAPLHSMTIKTMGNVTPGTKITVPVSVVAKSGEAGFDFSVKFDGNVLSNPVISKGSGVAPTAVLTTNTMHVSRGHLGILVTTGDATIPVITSEGVKEVVTITFDVAPNAAPGTYDLAFTNDPIDLYMSHLDTSEITGVTWINGGFTILPPAPTVTSITPNTGYARGGEAVTINGTGFTEGSLVKWGATLVENTVVNSDTQITATSPAGSVGQKINVTVETAGGTSNGVQYTYTANPPVVIVPSPSALSFGEKAEQKSVVVTLENGTTWSVAVNSGAPWLSIAGATTGASGGQFIVASELNKNLTERTGSIIISSGNVTKAVSVKQAGAVPVFTASATGSTQFTGAGGAGDVKTITANSNTGWKLLSKPEWVNVSPATGPAGDGQTLQVTAKTNPEVTVRTGNVVLESSAGTPKIQQTIAFTQDKGEPTLTLNAYTWNPEKKGGSVTVGVTSNVSGWSYFIPAGDTWLSAGNKTASGITLTAAENSKTESRVSTVRFTAQENGKTVTKDFVVTQKAGDATLSMSSAPLSATKGEWTSPAIAVQSNSSWNATSSAGWLTFVGSSSGVNNGSITVKASANTTVETRQATVSATTQDGKASASFVVTQEAGDATLSVTNTAALTTVPKAGIAHNIVVTSNTDWSVSKSAGADWLSYTPASGTSTGNINVIVPKNETVKARSATLTIAATKGANLAQAKQIVTVSQEAGDATLTLSSYAWDPEKKGGSVTVGVTSNVSGWSYFIPAGDTWLSAGNKTASGITLTATENSKTESRVSTVRFTAQENGKTVTKDFVVTQKAGDATLSMSSAPLSATKGEWTSPAIAVQSNSSWNATSSAGWLTFVGSSSGVNNGSITVKASANTTVETRQATVSATTQDGKASASFVVTQEAGDATLSVANTAALATVPKAGIAHNIVVTSNTDWSVSKSAGADWLSYTPASGTSTGNINVIVPKNETVKARSATLTIAATKGANLAQAKQIVTVSQEAGDSTLEVSCSSWAPDLRGDTNAVTVKSNSSWGSSVTGGASWLTIKGTTEQGFVLSARANDTPESRTVTVVITTAPPSGIASVSKSIAVTQAAGETSLRISTELLKMPAEGKTQDIILESNAAWDSVSSSEWITLSPAQGAAPGGNVTILVAENTTDQERVGSITFRTRKADGVGIQKTLTVYQEGAVSTLTLTPDTWDSPAEGGSLDVDIVTNASWTIPACPEWIKVSAKTGEGDGSITFTTLPNNTGENRSGDIAFVNSVGETLAHMSIEQASSVEEGDIVVKNARSSNVSDAVTLKEARVNAVGGEITLTIAAKCRWIAATSSTKWIKVSPSSGSANTEGTPVSEIVIKVSTYQEGSSLPRMGEVLIRPVGGTPVAYKIIQESETTSEDDSAGENADGEGRQDFSYPVLETIVVSPLGETKDIAEWGIMTEALEIPWITPVEGNAIIIQPNTEEKSRQARLLILTIRGVEVLVFEQEATLENS